MVSVPHMQERRAACVSRVVRYRCTATWSQTAFAAYKVPAPRVIDGPVSAGQGDLQRHRAAVKSQESTVDAIRDFGRVIR